jgi:hypothetical protein
MKTTNYSKIYQKYAVDKTRISNPVRKMQRGGFYQLLEYDYVNDEDSKTWSATSAPIIYVLYINAKDDDVHAIKLSEINPITVKQLFGKMLDIEDEEIDLGKNPKTFYESKLKNMPFFNKNFYRTYKLSGIRKLLELNMDTTKLVSIAKAKQIANGYRTYPQRGKSKIVDTNITD